VAETGKAHALNTISEHLIRGRWNEVRPPNEKELRATTVLQFEIEEASAKVRTGPPADDEEDYALPVWAGVLPLRLVAETPVPDTRMTGQCDVPDHVKRFQQNHD
jgi:hypothetical protein